MLCAKFVRAYTHTLRLHMMCTPFLVYTYVIHLYITLYVQPCMIVYFPFLFSNFSFWCMQIVYTTACTTSWNFTGISHSGTCYPDISTSIHQVYTAYYWKFQHINWLILHGWYSEVYSSHCISLLHDRTLMSTHFTAFILCTPCTHCVDTVTWVLRIRNVYIWYIYGTHLSTNRYIVYTTCIHPV